MVWSDYWFQLCFSFNSLFLGEYVGRFLVVSLFSSCCLLKNFFPLCIVTWTALILSGCWFWSIFVTFCTRSCIRSFFVSVLFLIILQLDLASGLRVVLYRVLCFPLILHPHLNWVVELFSLLFWFVNLMFQVLISWSVSDYFVLVMFLFLISLVSDLNPFAFQSCLLLGKIIF